MIARFFLCQSCLCVCVLFASCTFITSRALASEDKNKLTIFELMKNLYLFLLIFAPLLIASCGPNEPANLNVDVLEPVSESTPVASFPWEGTYLGDQDGYFLTKASGEPMVINGKKIPVPGSAYTISIKALGIEVIQLAKDESTGPVLYIGNCLVDVQSETKAQLSCTCKEQSSSKYPSEPEFSLAINLIDQTMVVNGNFGTEFIATRQ
jgi:hypothetical protein